MASEADAGAAGGWPLLWPLLALALPLLWLLLGRHRGHWARRGVPAPRPGLLCGNYADVLLARRSVGCVMTDLYRQFEGQPVVGFWRFRRPGLLVRDPDLVRDVLQKDFDSFSENGFRIDPRLDPLMSKNPFFLWGARWKRTRAFITPSFTTGKMKAMFPLMQEVARELESYLRTAAPTSGGDGLEAKDVASRFTMDVVASCAFGIQGNSFKAEETDLRRAAHAMLQPGLLRNLEFLLIQFLPSLGSLLNLRWMPKETDRFFRSVVRDAVEYRQKNGVVRPDFLQQMLALEQRAAAEGGVGGGDEFTEEDVAAHAVTFITDGFETSSIVLSFALFELARSPAAQSRLRDELGRACAAAGGQLTYETVVELPYLDQVLQETLRLHPPLMAMEKLCTRRTQLGPARLDAGTLVVLPLMGLHTDPRYFPQPDAFRPERFAPGAEPPPPRYAFLPFGEGPRMCLGMRFGSTQTKLALATVVRAFEVRPSARTVQPIRQDPTYFLRCAQGGLWLHFSPLPAAQAAQ